MRAAGRRARGQSGFTLLEVILAMTLLSMVTGIVYAAFHLAVRSVEKGQMAVVGAQRARAASDVIRRQVKSMFPYPCRLDDGEDPVPYFEVKENPPMLAFVTAAGLHGGGGLEHVRYEVAGNPPQLVLTVSPVFWFDDGQCGKVVTRDSTEAVLLDGFRKLAFEPQVYEDGDNWRSGDGVVEFGLPRSVHVVIDGMAGAPPPGEVRWRVPIMANLESEDGWRVFAQMFEEGEGITVPGDAPKAAGGGQAADAADSDGADDAADAESDADVEEDE
jgi:prepilin-type N-terminal cleavage/methylation domain-containing protein